jgi:hypothetical protein
MGHFEGYFKEAKAFLIPLLSKNHLNTPAF